MRQAILTLTMVMLAMLPARAINYANETLHYEIIYQWGVVWKHAGDATLSIHKSGSGYQAMLTGKTRSWADKVYPVRDTLKCSINNKLQPVHYEKLTHEKSYWARDVLDFKYNYGHTTAHGTRYRKSGNATIDLSAQCQAYDMLSVFYMLRTLDMSQLARDGKMTTVIFSGKLKEYLTISYNKLETIKMRDGTKRKAHRLSFRFTQKGGKQSSDNISVWLSTDDTRVPLLLVGKLPVGQVKCYYKP